MLKKKLPCLPPGDLPDPGTEAASLMSPALAGGYHYLFCSHEQYEKAKDKTLKDELPSSVSAQYATGDQGRNNSRKNEGMEPKQKQDSTVDMTGDGSKVRCCKEQYCIGTWNVRSMNQCKLEVVKQEMIRMNRDILGMSELR